MYSPPQSAEPEDLHDWLLQKHNAFLKAYEVVRRHATAQQRRLDSVYNKRVHGPTYKEGRKLHYPVIRIGKNPKLSSPWRGPYRIFKSSDKNNHQIKEPTTGKVQVVHYDRLKRYHGPIPVASKFPTQPTTHTTVYQTHSFPNFDHSQCGQTSLLFSFAPQMTSPALFNRPSSSPNPSPTLVMDVFLDRTSSSNPPTFA